MRIFLSGRPRSDQLRTRGGHEGAPGGRLGPGAENGTRDHHAPGEASARDVGASKRPGKIGVHGGTYGSSYTRIGFLNHKNVFGFLLWVSTDWKWFSLPDLYLKPRKPVSS